MNSLSDIQPASRRGLYVHIPFCLKKCHYCDFVITTKRDSATKTRFFSAFEAELKHSTEKFGRLRFDTLYLGGGTPSALDPDEFNSIYRSLTQVFDFAPDFEFTVEVNPGDVDPAKIDAYRQSGVNRVSLGVQAFQENLLKDMNRPHGVFEVNETVEALRRANLTNISMDMILNLPGQTQADAEETLKRLLDLKPNQISVYDLDVHERTVYGQRRREGRLHLGGEEAHERMAETVSRTLESEGLRQYELSNFARPGCESKHNLIYWDNQPYLGLGPGAFSYMNGVRYQFSDSVDEYFKKADSADWKPRTEDILTPEEIEKETLLTGIRLREGIDLRRFRLLKAKFEETADNFLKEGLLEKDGFRLKFTSRGKLLADLILPRFAQVK